MTPRSGDLTIEQMAANLNRTKTNLQISTTVHPRRFKKTTARFRIVRFFVKAVITGKTARKVIVVELEMLELITENGGGKTLKVGRIVTELYKNLHGYI